MSRFSKAEAEALGWKFIHNVEADATVTSETQGEVRFSPETHVAEKYHSVAGGPSQIIHEEGETMGKLLERINLFEETQKRLQPETVEPVGVEVNALNLDAESGLPLRTVTVPVDPTDLSADKETMQITEEEWAARDRADVLVVRGEDGKPTQVTYGGSSPVAMEAYDLKLAHEAEVENARTAQPDVETEQIDLDPSQLIDAPGATGTGRIVVLKGEESMAEVQERKQEGKVEKENARAVEQALVGPQGVAPEGQEDLVGVDAAHAEDTDLESEQPRLTQGEAETIEATLSGEYEPAGADGPTAEAAQEVRDAESEAVEGAAKEARDEDLATADDDEHVAEAREAGLEARDEAQAEQTEEAQDAVDATPAAQAAAEEKGVDLTEVEGTGKDGRVTKADVEKAAE